MKYLPILIKFLKDHTHDELCEIFGCYTETCDDCPFGNNTAREDLISELEQLGDYMGWKVKLINIQCGCNAEYLVKEVNAFIKKTNPSQVKVDFLSDSKAIITYLED